MIRDMIEDPILGLLICVPILLILFFFSDGLMGERSERYGYMYTETYSPNTQTTTTGAAFTSKGVAPVIMHSGHPEKYSIIVKYSDSEYEKIDCSVSLYYSVKPNEKVKVLHKSGYFTKIIYATHVVKL